MGHFSACSSDESELWWWGEVGDGFFGGCSSSSVSHWLLSELPSKPPSSALVSLSARAPRRVLRMIIVLPELTEVSLFTL